MNPEHRNFLASSYRELAELIDLNQLMRYLIPKKVFTNAMLEDIYRGDSETEKKEFLLQELCTRGPNAFRKFLDALELSGHARAVNFIRSRLDCPEMLNRVSSVNKYHRSVGTRVTGDAPFQFSVVKARELEYGPGIYKMTSKPRGYCLLINNVKFEGAMDERTGSDADAQKLDTVFRDLGYDVKYRSNLRAGAMLELLEEFSKKPEHSKVDSCIVIILSHGGRQCVYGTDEVAVFIEEIKHAFDNENCPHLRKKPKMFFIQACRGKVPDIGVSEIRTESTDSAKTVPPEPVVERLATLSDMLVSYSTVEGYISILHPDVGAWYCQELVRVLSQRAWNSELIEMLQEVDSMVQGKISGDGVKQSTSFECIGWNKKLYFNPGIYGLDLALNHKSQSY